MLSLHSIWTGSQLGALIDNPPPEVAMFIVVQHSISDPSVFWNSADSHSLSKDVELHHTFPSPDGTRAYPEPIEARGPLPFFRSRQIIQPISRANALTAARLCHPPPPRLLSADNAGIPNMAASAARAKTAISLKNRTSTWNWSRLIPIPKYTTHTTSPTRIPLATNR